MRRLGLTLKTGLPVPLLCYAAKTRRVEGISIVSTLVSALLVMASGVRRVPSGMESDAKHLDQKLTMAAESSRWSLDMHARGTPHILSIPR